MKKLVLAVVLGMIASVSMAGEFIGMNSKAKLLTMVTSGTVGSSPDVEVSLNWTDFESMRACQEAVWLLTSAPSVKAVIDADGLDGPYEAKGLVLPKKAGPQGNAVEYSFRCVPNSGRYTYYNYDSK